MQIQSIRGFDDFLRALHQVGFSVSGGRSGGGIGLQDHYASNIHWHTGADTDPWRWRMRVLDEYDDIAYAKVFLGNGGYITRAWYQDFLAVRRVGRDFQDFYEDGLLSAMARRAYRAVSEGGRLAYHEIKRAIGFEKGEESALQTALIHLQRNMLLTICGETQRVNRDGIPYGWSINVFTTPERFWGEDFIEEAGDMDSDESYAKIFARIREYNTSASDAEVRKFILA